MSLEEAVKRAREIADRSIDPFDHARANALEGALHAERHPPLPPGDTTGLSKWSEISRPAD